MCFLLKQFWTEIQDVQNKWQFASLYHIRPLDLLSYYLPSQASQYCTCPCSPCCHCCPPPGVCIIKQLYRRSSAGPWLAHLARDSDEHIVYQLYFVYVLQKKSNYIMRVYFLVLCFFLFLEEENNVLWLVNLCQSFCVLLECQFLDDISIWYVSAAVVRRQYVLTYWCYCLDSVIIHFTGLFSISLTDACIALCSLIGHQCGIWKIMGKAIFFVKGSLFI